MNKDNAAAFDDLLQTLPPFIFRKDPRLKELTGKTARTWANLDSKGEGIPGRVKIGGSVAYPRKELVEYLLSQTVISEA